VGAQKSSVAHRLFTAALAAFASADGFNLTELWWRDYWGSVGSGFLTNFNSPVTAFAAYGIPDGVNHVITLPSDSSVNHWSWGGGTLGGDWDVGPTQGGQ
jgi:hypothetical protein